MTAARSGTPRIYLLAVLTLLTLAVLVSLGTWQVRRLAWKEALIERIEKRRAAAPVPLAEVEREYAQGGDVDYQPVTLAGRFEHGGEQHFFATHKGASGYYVYTPLRLADGRAILLNRGFVPFDRKDPATRKEGQVEGDVAVTGLARNPLSEKPSGVYENNPDRNIYYWKDRDAMARAAGLDPARLLPFFVDADDAPNPGGWPMGGVTVVSLPNNHLQYAITWYGLALALAGVFAFWLAQVRRRD